MIIGIDASRATSAHPTGTELYSREIIRALLHAAPQDSFRLYMRGDADLPIEDVAASVEIVNPAEVAPPAYPVAAYEPPAYAPPQPPAYPQPEYEAPPPGGYPGYAAPAQPGYYPQPGYEAPPPAPQAQGASGGDCRPAQAGSRGSVRGWRRRRLTRTDRIMREPPPRGPTGPGRRVHTGT